MKMRNSFSLLLAAAALAWAQSPPPAGHGGFGSAGPRFLGAEAGMPRRVVKGAPFSGDLVTESTETLADGNRIHQTSTAHMVRDSEGRTRREESLAGLGALAAGGGAQQVVFIHDPVAGANYALDSVHKTANKSAWIGPSSGKRPFAAATEARREMRAGNVPQSVKTEALGAAAIEGLQAQGTRTTVTIAAGAIGNDSPIQVVTERWYSADLQMVILSKRSDPRSGETVTRLTNVSRAEPSSALFQVPPDFKVTERPAPRFRPSAAAPSQ
jgi:hypothetical protein